MGIAPMRILYVYGMAETKDIPITLRKMGYKVEEYPKVQENSILNDEETEAVVAYVKRHRITHLMSIHLIYNLPWLPIRPRSNMFL